MSASTPPDDRSQAGPAALRLDKWLWFARFFKTRSLAARILEAGGVRVRGAPAKPHTAVRPDDVVTFSVGGSVRVVRVVALGTRRGPAVEARALYEDLTPQVSERPSEGSSPFHRGAGSGRPTKAERRALDRLRTRGED
ncbi:MAG TPA: RNA-binding S4 domain-containing protein [Alphaproteobacteria bacterium]|nr:RNA-binding S4 domain-containing protein [Alphaproteobacteria bacterium]